jgi:Uma2 family endonuclease
LVIIVEPIEELPAIDERLALPGAGYEILDGVVTFVAPADPPHGEQHQTVAVLVGAHARHEYKVALDLLTRTSKIDDIAPDVSVYLRAPHPVTGGRQLEELAFEIVSTESMSHATTKAAKLAGRGVRRVFAIDVVRRRVLEWSPALESWSVLDLGARIADPALAVELPVGALLSAANPDDDVARALLAKHNPVIEATIETTIEQTLVRGHAEAVIAVLVARGVALSGEHRARILAERAPARLAAWLARVATCVSVAELLGED